jgi:uncharacterized protein (DUF1697 family)
MNKYVTLLRGINVGGHRKILMTNLKVLFEKLGALNVITYIQSGNVIFEHNNSTANELSLTIAKAIKNKFNFEVPIITFPVEKFKKIVNENPFVNDSSVENLHVTFLSSSLTTKEIEAVTEQTTATNKGQDECEITERAVFIKCEEKYHQSILSNQYFEKKLSVFASTRNWKTILKIIDLIN